MKEERTKSDELLQMIRLYQIGLAPPIMVKNALNCVFADTMLDLVNESGDESLVNGCFEKMLNEW